jgi:atypical dual specificity phosphatase
MHGFSWLVPRGLAGCARPGALRPLAEDLGALRAEGITWVVTLSVEALDPAALEAAGLGSLHLPVEDYSAPSQEQLRAFVDAVRATWEEGGAVAVHCLAGKGRTGTALAAWLVAAGMQPAAAIAAVRAARPGSIETAVQERAVQDFGRARQSR